MASRGTAGGLAASAIGALLLLAPSASALTTVEVKGVDLGDGAYAGTAVCPNGQRVVSGGFDSTPGATPVVNKAKGKRSWTAKVLDGPSFLTVFAYCSRRLEVSKASDSVRPNAVEPRTATARCRGDATAVAGGWSFKPNTPAGGNNQPVFKSTRKGKRKWAVTAFAEVDGDEQDRLSAFAYCLEGAEVKVRSDLSDPIPQNTNEFVEVECKPGEELLGGGFKTSPKSDYGNDTGPDFFYFGSAKVGARGWHAEANNYGQTGRITVTAICRQ